jgi:hypothetical protein
MSPDYGTGLKFSTSWPADPANVLNNSVSHLNKVGRMTPLRLGTPVSTQEDPFHGPSPSCRNPIRRTWGSHRGFFFALLISGSFFSGAFADTPSSWEKVEPVSVFSMLMLILVWPVVIALVLTFLTYLPSLARRGAKN